VRLDKADFEKVRATRGIAKWWPVRDHVPAFTGNAAQFAQHARERTRRLVAVDGDDDGGGSGARANVTLSSHVVTQVDRLHAQGLTGKGVKVAIICGGVCSRSWAWGLRVRLRTDRSLHRSTTSTRHSAVAPDRAAWYHPAPT